MCIFMGIVQRHFDMFRVRKSVITQNVLPEGARLSFFIYIFALSAEELLDFFATRSNRAFPDMTKKLTTPCCPRPPINRRCCDEVSKTLKNLVL